VTDDSRPTGDWTAVGRVGDGASPNFARGRLGDLNGDVAATVLEEEEDKEEEEGGAAPRAGLRPGAPVALALEELLCTFCEEERTKVRPEDSGLGRKGALRAERGCKRLKGEEREEDKGGLGARHTHRGLGLSDAGEPVGVKAPVLGAAIGLAL